MQEAADIVFVVDSSQDVSETAFDNIKKYLVSTISALNKPKNIRTSVVSYGDGKEDLTIPLDDDSLDKQAISALIKNMPKFGGERTLYDALVYVKNNVLLNTAEASKHIVFVSSGPVKDPVIIEYAVDNFKKNNKFTYTFIVLDDNAETLKQIEKISKENEDIVDINGSDNLPEYYANVIDAIKKAGRLKPKLHVNINTVLL